jgi:opine dehydrogenase
VVTPGGPDTFHHRYITEDVPYGLVLMSSLGRAMGVPTPTCDHVVRVAGAVMGRDYFSEGRTLERLGIEHLGPEELLAFLERG